MLDPNNRRKHALWRNTNLGYLETMQTYLAQAIDAALAGNWAQAHDIVKDDEDPYACWIHAVLHKIEGDPSNSRYWYTQTPHDFEDYADPHAELLAIKAALGAK